MGAVLTRDRKSRSGGKIRRTGGSESSLSKDLSGAGGPNSPLTEERGKREAEGKLETIID